MSGMLIRDWFSAAELAALGLPGMPTTKPNVIAMAERLNWRRDDWKDSRWRERQGRGGGIEYHYSALPHAAQAWLALKFTKVEEANERDAAKREMSRDEIWRWFEQQPDKKKAEAKRRLEALETVRALMHSGIGKLTAARSVAADIGVSLATFYGWETAVRGIERHDWMPYLAPRHVGRMVTEECTPEAWEMLKALYLRLEKPTFERCFRDVTKTAAQKGWALPSERTLKRRMDALPEGLRVLAREGSEALKRMYPAQERDYSVFHAMEAVNADGHKWDVFVKWPDGYIGRPVMVGFQDLYSGKILSWRLDRSENKEVVRLAFGDMVGEHGIPDHCWLDNGRNFASKWLTGGTPNRYRFKVKEDEPDGIMTMLGVNVHWTTPYWGQAKRIERAWLDLARDAAKHPRFAGAYTGNNPTAKPENYQSTAVPLDVFVATIAEEIRDHNARSGRRTATAQGRSLDETFQESYDRSLHLVRKATAEQHRLWLLAAEGITAAKVDGSVEIFKNRYWAEFLANHRGEKLTVRFDPQNLHGTVHVYRLDGAYLGAAPCLEKVGANDQAAGREQARNRNEFRRAQKKSLEAERRMSLADAAALLPEAAEPAPALEQKIVRPVFGNTALKPRPIEEDSDPDDRVVNAMTRLHQVRAGQARLAINQDGDD